MPNNAALRLDFGPDNYQCTWAVPDLSGRTVHHLSGIIEVRGDQPPSGVVTGNIPTKWTSSDGIVKSARFPQSRTWPVLSGRTANGASVQLLDAFVKEEFPGWASITGSAALFAFGSTFPWRLPPPAPFGFTPAISSVRFQITGLDALFGAPPLTMVSFPQTEEGAWSARLNPQSEREWSTGATRLRLGYYPRTDFGGGYGLRIAFSPVATLHLERPITLRPLLDDWVLPLLRIASLALGKPQTLTYLAVDLDAALDQNASQSAQVFGTGITQEPVDCDLDLRRKPRSAFSLAEDGMSPLDLLFEWQRLISERHPLVETYGSMMHYPGEHPRSRFLLLLQVIEGLHGAATRRQYLSRKSTYETKRRLVLDSTSNCLNAANQKFLEKNLNMGPRSGLDSALRGVIRSLPVDLTSEIQGTRLVTGLMTDTTGDRADSPEAALRIARNNLAHGVLGYDPRELNEVVVILDRIVRAHAFRLLGCADEVLLRVLQNSS